MTGAVRTVVIPAAGLGTRFLPATKAVPKEMLPVFDRPAIQVVVEEAAASGVRDVVLVTGKGKEAVARHFARAPRLEGFLRTHGDHARLREILRIVRLARVRTARQDRPRGLGHAVLCARRAVGGKPFAVILPDDIIASRVPALRQLTEVARRRGGSVVALMEVPASRVSSYGIAAGEWVGARVMRIRTMVEKPPADRAPSRLAIIGRYVLSPRIFDLLARTRRGAIGEIQLTDALAALCREEPVYGVRFEGRRFDAGSKVGYVEACLHYALADPQAGPAIRTLLRRGPRGI